jgi:hypothetical protein
MVELFGELHNSLLMLQQHRQDDGLKRPRPREINISLQMARAAGHARYAMPSLKTPEDTRHPGVDVPPSFWLVSRRYLSDNEGGD